MRGWLITHKDCLDGATAALVGENADLKIIFVEPDRVDLGLQQVTDDRPVYLADVSLKPPQWQHWKQRITHLLDHHQSALPLAGEPNVTLDLRRSGGHLMYDYAVSQQWMRATEPWQRLCLAVERYDLWKPDHDFGQNLNRLFHHQGYAWYRARFFSGYVPFTSEEATLLATIIRHETAFIDHHVEHAMRYQKDLPYPIYAVHLEEEGPINMVSHRLIDRGAALVLSIKPDHRLSARSDARVDAAALMEALFQGGGHARAAGGRLPTEETKPETLLADVAQFLRTSP